MALNKKAAGTEQQEAQQAAQAPEPATGGKNTAAAKKAAADKQRDTERGTYVYIGPSLPRGRLKHNFIMEGTRGDIKGYLADVLDHYPQIMRLVVPAAKLAESTQKAETKGNILNKYYNDILSAAASAGREE